MKREAVITGASSGLGKEIKLALEKEDWLIHNWSTDAGVDITNYRSVFAASQKIDKRVDVLINCAGINLINYLEYVEEQEWDSVMDTNAKGIFLCTQALLFWLTGGAVINIVSNAAHVPMTSSLAYNASKGAALMMTRQLARELRPRHGITVFSISPNKLAGTGMSKDIERQVCKIRGWTEEYAREYQLKALLTGEETNPQDLANFVAYLLRRKENHKWFAGCDIPYGL